MATRSTSSKPTPKRSGPRPATPRDVPKKVKHPEREPRKMPEGICPHFSKCGGCQTQDVPYELQLANKTNHVRRILTEALPAVAIDLRSTLGSSVPWGQRTKVGFRIVGEPGRLRPAMYRARSRLLLPITTCPVQSEKATRLAFGAIDAANQLGIPAWDERNARGVFRAVVTRQAPGPEQRVHVILVCARAKVEEAQRWAALIMEQGADGVSFSHHPDESHLLLSQNVKHLAGHQRLNGELAGVNYVISPGAFFQTSQFGVKELVYQVCEAVGVPEGQVLDLYSGAGLFALAMARKGVNVTAIEENPSAVEDAEVAKRINNLTNVKLLQGKVVTHLRTMVRNLKESPATVVMDPPRTGCERGVIDAVCRDLKPQRIVYVSCDLTAFARDIAGLAKGGYRVRYVQPIDMFPHTELVEVVAVLDRIPAPPRISANARRQMEAWRQAAVAEATPAPPAAPTRAGRPVAGRPAAGRPAAGPRKPSRKPRS